MINIRITDASGDTSLSQELETAISTVIEAHFKQAKWPYVNSKVFQFASTSTEDPTILSDTARLREMLLEAPEGVTVVLAGELAGGSGCRCDACLAQEESEEEAAEEEAAEEEAAEEAAAYKKDTDDTPGIDTAKIKAISKEVAEVIAKHLQDKDLGQQKPDVFELNPEALNDPSIMLDETITLMGYLQRVGGPVTVTISKDQEDEN